MLCPWVSKSSEKVSNSSENTQVRYYLKLTRQPTLAEVLVANVLCSCISRNTLVEVILKSHYLTNWLRGDASMPFPWLLLEVQVSLRSPLKFHSNSSKPVKNFILYICAIFLICIGIAFRRTLCSFGSQNNHENTYNFSHC